jgi:pimeloyl-ACP methyl ester carboxylesterase
VTGGSLDPVGFEVTSGGTRLSGESSGDGPDVILCHGLSATRRYVVHGSRLLPRRGYRLHVYDARGHGESAPAGPGEGYGYEYLVADLERVIAGRADPGPVVAGGHSMGCHTVAAWALRNPESVGALVLVGPVYTGDEDEAELGRWDERADALAQGGPEQFGRAAAAGLEDPEIHATVERLARERAALHRHPEAVAEALRQVPRSRPFGTVGDLARIDAPVLVVGTRDEADPGHPYAVAERWAEAIPGAEMVSEEPGESPLSWQGGRLSREIAGFLERHGIVPVPPRG